MEEENDELEEYRNLRYSIMSEKEIKLADKFLDWYRKAHEDKTNRGLYQKWEIIESYWEGDLEEPIDDSDPCSNTNIVNSNVEGKVALLAEQNLATQVDPIEPSDRSFCEQVRIIADFIKDKNKMFRKIDVHERRREKFGTGIFRVLWKPKELDGLGIPEITPLNPAYVFVDPAITDIYKIQDARFIIEITNKSIYQARLKYGDDIANAIIPNYNPIEETYKFNSVGDNDNESYLHLFVWTKYRDKKGETQIRLVEMSGDGIILSDTKKENEDNEQEEKPLFPNSIYPYFFTPDMYREGTIWGKASAELLLSISDQIDELDNQILRNAVLSGNPQREVDSGSGIDAEKLTNEPGLVILTNKPNGSRWITPPTIPNYIMEKRKDIIANDRFIVSRFSDQMIGSKQTGVTTASEALALQQAGNSSIAHKKGLLEETLSEAFEYAVELALLNWNTTMLFRIVGNNGEETFTSFNPSSLNSIPLLSESTGDYRKEYKEKNPDAKPEEYEYMQVDGETRKVKYDLRMTVGAGLPNNKAYRYSLMLESFDRHIITTKECRQYLIKNLGLNIPEIPESVQEQQEIGVFSEETLSQIQQSQQTQQNKTSNAENMIKSNADIAGLTDSGNVSLKEVKEGIM